MRSSRACRPQAFVRRASSDGGGSLSFLAPAPRCVRSKRKARRDSKSSKHAAHRGRRGARDRQPRAARWQHRAVPGLIDVSSRRRALPVFPRLPVWLAPSHCQRSMLLRPALLRVLRAITDRLNSVCCSDASNCADGFPRSCDASCAAVRIQAVPRRAKPWTATSGPARPPARSLAKPSPPLAAALHPPTLTYGRAPAAGVAAVRAAVRRLRLGQLPQPRRVLAPLHDIRSWPAGRAAASGSRWPLLC